MRTYRYPLGHVAGQTMTVAEMRKVLEAYPDDMPVFCEWEGVWAYVEPENFVVIDVDKGRDDESAPALVIDVNKY